jgi:hypothetical protein
LLIRTSRFCQCLSSIWLCVASDSIEKQNDVVVVVEQSLREANENDDNDMNNDNDNDVYAYSDDDDDDKDDNRKQATRYQSTNGKSKQDDGADDATEMASSSESDDAAEFKEVFCDKQVLKKVFSSVSAFLDDDQTQVILCK